jgi:hypothetical protein
MANLSRQSARNESPPVHLNCAVRDQDFVLDAIEDAQRILAEHIEPSCHRNPETTIMLLCLLDRREVVAAVRRLRDGYGLRVSRSRPAGARVYRFLH